LDSIKPLQKIIDAYQPGFPVPESYFLKEFLLWELASYKKLSKNRFTTGYQFNDVYGDFIRKL